ncbi:MAG: MATE family efflux transporter [Spirochaetaceae bacterium]|nr:MATE family efflux transporter [Spirochaetaceae bacterium]
MTETPVERLVCGLAVPSIVIMLISALYNMADTYFVSSLGTSAVAAVGVVFPLMAVIQALGFFFGHGSGNYISRRLGAQDFDSAARMATTGFFSALIAGALVGGAGLFFISPLSRFLGSTGTILPYAREYMRFILIGTPWMAGSLVLNNQLRFQGSASYAMVGMVSGAVLNMGLDPLFIFVLKLGVTGASLATCISQAVGCLILLRGCTGKGNLAIRFRNFTPRLTMYKEMLRGGLPSLFRQGLGSVGAIILNHFAGIYGDAAIAAISIVNRVNMMAFSVMVGFGQGFQPVCGFNYGAGLYSRVKKAFWFCVRLTFLIALPLTVLGVIFAPQIIAAFRREDLEVVRIGTLSLRLVALAFPLMGWVLLSNMMLQTIGKPVEASLLAMSRQTLFLIPFLFILSPALGLFGIQLSQPAADVASVIFAVPITVKVLRDMKEDRPGGVPKTGPETGREPAAEPDSQLAAHLGGGGSSRPFPIDRPPHKNKLKGMIENTPVFLAFAAGLLSFFSPCVLPLIPSWLFLLGGVGPEDAAGGSGARGRFVPATLCFVLGFGAVFVIISMIFAGTLRFLAGLRGLISILSGIIVIILGLNAIFDFLKFLNTERRFHPAGRVRGPAGALAAGLAFGAGWTPCVGPILGSVLLLAGQSGRAAGAVVCLAAYSAGLGLPFIGAALLFDRGFTGRLFARLQPRLPLIKRLSGVFLMAIGVLILTGRYQAWGARGGNVLEERLNTLQAGSREQDRSAAIGRALAGAGLPALSRPLPAGDFSLPRTTGGRVSLSDLAGKVVFLNFWATWCPPCRAEMPSMETLYRRYRERGLEILAVSVGETREKAAAFMEEYHLSFTAALDGDQQVSARYNIQAFPTTFIINREGQVVSWIVGGMDWSDAGLEGVFEALLNESGSPSAGLDG